MSRLRVILGSGIVAVASLALTPAAYAQSDRQACPGEALCLYGSPEWAAPPIPAGQNVTFYPPADASRAINNSSTPVAVCGELLCQLIEPYSGEPLRDTPAGSVFWR